MDDGPATMEESVAMALLLCAAGYTTVYCTPHLIKGNFEADNEAVRGAVAALQEELDRERIALHLLPGRKYYLDEFFADQLQDPLPLGKTRQILIEIPNHTPVEFVKESCYRIKGKGYIPLIAHPERCLLLEPKQQKDNRKGIWGSLFTVNLKTENPDLLNYLQEIDCQFQGNLGSFVGRYGERVRANAERLRQMGTYSCYGTDGHSHEGLKAVLSLSFERLIENL